MTIAKALDAIKNKQDYKDPANDIVINYIPDRDRIDMSYKKASFAIHFGMFAAEPTPTPTMMEFTIPIDTDGKKSIVRLANKIATLASSDFKFRSSLTDLYVSNCGKEARITQTHFDNHLVKLIFKS